MPYPTLFSPGTINHLTLKNRLVMTPMGCGLANTDGTITNEFISYYEERAKGGVALIYTEVACVNSEHGRRSEHQIWLTDERQLPMLQKLTSTIHQYGCAIFPQLLHPGVISTNAANEGRPLPGPSGVISKFLKQKARAFERDELKSLVQDFVKAAVLAKQAGFDGVEIHAAHHYLLHEFLSPYINKRTDEYGGCFENRCRLLLEIVDAVRNAVGRDYPISVRVSAEDYMGDESYHLDENLKLCQLLEKHSVDVISVSAGGTENGRSHSLEPISYAQGWRRHLAKAVRSMVNIPVIATTVIRDPDYAESLLNEGYLDFVGMGRSFLADPQWPAKAAAGHPEDIRKCISCLRCIDSIKAGQPIVCSINPECGFEYAKKDPVPDGDGRLCVVVGGGVAGLECARILALRKFRVCLYERESHLGGQVWLAAQAPKKDKMLWFIDYEGTQLKKLGVDICLDHVMTADEVLKLKPYLIVDATGSAPYLPPIEGIHNPLVTTPVEILSGKCDLHDQSVVLFGTGLTGLETAEYLAVRGNMVTVIGESPKIAPGGGSSVIIGEILRALDQANAVIMTGRKLLKIGTDRVIYQDVASGEVYELPCDKVVICKGVRSCGKLATELHGRHPNVRVIGDAERVGRIREDVLAGYQAAMEA
jgi:2,4-dienoyl-CoA reductase-like NADH-dependent reductase (Old Yellow Enzyme family)/thioredoxin reductase